MLTGHKNTEILKPKKDQFSEDSSSESACDNLNDKESANLFRDLTFKLDLNSSSAKNSFNLSPD